MSSVEKGTLSVNMVNVAVGVCNVITRFGSSERNVRRVCKGALLPVPMWSMSLANDARWRMVGVGSPNRPLSSAFLPDAGRWPAHPGLSEH